jgi:hypothetical protein
VVGDLNYQTLDLNNTERGNDFLRCRYLEERPCHCGSSHDDGFWRLGFTANGKERKGSSVSLFYSYVSESRKSPSLKTEIRFALGVIWLGLRFSDGLDP